jgi:hypothetical protein
MPDKPQRSAAVCVLAHSGHVDAVGPGGLPAAQGRLPLSSRGPAGAEPQHRGMLALTGGRGSSG